MIQQWHCDFSDPQLLTSGVNVAVQYRQQDCYVTASSSYGLSTSSPFYTQDAGNLSFALGLIIVILFLAVIGFMFNSMTNKKRTW